MNSYGFFFDLNSYDCRLCAIVGITPETPQHPGIRMWLDGGQCFPHLASACQRSLAGQNRDHVRLGGENEAKNSGFRKGSLGPKALEVARIEEDLFYSR